MIKDVIDWLLEDENPAIKYRTLTEICNAPLEECNDTYSLILEDKAILRMFQKQDENGIWSNKNFGMFTPLRYLTAFAEYGLYKEERLDSYVNYTIKLLQECEKPVDLAGCGVPLTLRALIMLGYNDRNDVRDLINKYSQAQLYDGGFMCKMKLDKKPDRKSCYKAAVASLLLYAECARKNIFLDNTENLVNYFLKRNVFYSSDKIVKFDEGRFGWRFIDNFFPVEPMRIGLPLIISALSILGAGAHPALSEAWEMLEKNKDAEGKLKLDGTLTKQPCSFGVVGKSNKWITFYSLLAEKNNKYF